MANAPFQIHFLSLYRRGGCFRGHVILLQHVSTPRPTRRLAQVFPPANPHLPYSSRRLSTARRPSSRKRCALLGGCGWGLAVEVGQDTGLGGCCNWFASLARCAALFACLVCCFVLAIGCLCPCWVSLPCYNWHPVWFVSVPAEGNRFALGTGGIRWSLLVGGLGPVLSIPKLCFKPFRKRSPNVKSANFR